MGRISSAASITRSVVTRRDIDRALALVETLCGPDTANLLRAYLAQLEGQIRVYELEQDEEWPTTP